MPTSCQLPAMLPGHTCRAARRPLLRLAAAFRPFHSSADYLAHLEQNHAALPQVRPPPHPTLPLAAGAAG